MALRAATHSYKTIRNQGEGVRARNRRRPRRDYLADRARRCCRRITRWSQIVFLRTMTATHCASTISTVGGESACGDKGSS